MAKRKGKKRPPKQEGEVYILKIWIGTKVYLKVGHTKRTARCRLVEIGTELLGQLGYFPKMSLVVNKVVLHPEQVEADILERTREYRPRELGFEFNGVSELRDMCVDQLMLRYNECIVTDYIIKPPELVQM